jgi:O-antigen ligase
VVIADGLAEVLANPSLWSDWTTALTQQHGNPLVIVGIALLVFPKLALGLSGFETGVAVMPHINSGPG